MFKEFREFAMKGSVIDMAVGIVHRWCVHTHRQVTGG